MKEELEVLGVKIQVSYELNLSKEQLKETEKFSKEADRYLQSQFDQMAISALMGCIHGEYTVIKDKKLP